MKSDELIPGCWYMIINPNISDRRYDHYVQGKLIDVNIQGNGFHQVQLWKGGKWGGLETSGVDGVPRYRTIHSKSFKKEIESPEPEIGSELWAEMELKKWEEHKAKVFKEYHDSKKNELCEILLPMLGIDAHFSHWSDSPVYVKPDNIERLNKALKLLVKHELLPEAFDTPDLPVVEYTPIEQIEFDLDTQEPTTPKENTNDGDPA